MSVQAITIPEGGPRRREASGDNLQPDGTDAHFMGYSSFTLAHACQSFGLTVESREDLFSATPEAPVSPLLRSILDETIPLATSFRSEKALSEFIVAPILVEVRKLMDRRISLFSGVNFDVEPDRGLSGFCDFLMTNSPIQLYIESPVLAVVEAKNDDISSGLGQCVAEMVAARIFNERGGKGPSIIHGLVTTGSVWQFLKLDGDKVYVDRVEYYLDQLERILGILLRCVGRSAA